VTDAADAPPLLDRAWLTDLREHAERADGLVLALDFDGTLAPIVDGPDAASIDSTTRSLLAGLAAAPATTVAVVSGRSLRDLRERVGVDGITYFGNHGLEYDDGEGRSVTPAARDAQPTLERAVATLRERLADVPGCRVENKRLTATVHYRQTPAEQVSTVEETVETVADATDALRLTRGKAILEIRPDIPAGKDRAIEFLREKHPGAVPLFVGDDVTDEDAFRAVAGDGFGVLVGDRSDTAATVRVPDTDCVTVLLGWLATVPVDTGIQTDIR